MYLKVTITKGTGRVSCTLPAFHLEEGKKSFAFIQEKTPQMKDLEDMGFITIEVAKDKEVEDHIKKLSKKFNERAKNKKRKQLERLKETGGKEQVVLGSGVIVTQDYGDISKKEIQDQAKAELKALDGDTSDLDAMLGDLVSSD